MYSLYLYFTGLSLRTTSKALTKFRDEKGIPYLLGIGFNYLFYLKFKENTYLPFFSYLNFELLV